MDSVFCPMPPQPRSSNVKLGRVVCTNARSLHPRRPGFDPTFYPAVGTDCGCRGSLIVSVPGGPRGNVYQTPAARRARECPPQAGFFFMFGSEGSRLLCGGGASFSLSLSPSHAPLPLSRSLSLSPSLSLSAFSLSLPSLSLPSLSLYIYISLSLFFHVMMASIIWSVRVVACAPNCDI